MNFLNAGGNPALLEGSQVDLTNDRVDETILITNNPVAPTRGILYVFGCSDKEYHVLHKDRSAYDGWPWVSEIIDMNMNGVPELVIGQLTCHYCTGMSVYEWDGWQVQSLVRNWIIIVDGDQHKVEYGDFAELSGYATGYVQDIDGNGTIEIVIEGGTPSYAAGLAGADGPWRKGKLVYMWDGNYFVWHSYEYITPPEFRFQALQDGDIASEAGRFKDALISYQDVIENDDLLSWSTDTREKYSELKTRELQGTPVVLGEAIPFDQTEYDQLFAYVRFRIMLLHILRGWNSDAETVYVTLQQEVTPESAGYPYLEMATLFWAEYSSSGDSQGVRTCNCICRRT